jgi:DNA-directed RNA polymerase alpha subunit
MKTIDSGTVMQKREAIRPSQMSHVGKHSVPIINQCLLDRLDAEGILLDKISVDVLGLDDRQLRTLTATGIRDLRQLCTCTEGDLLNIPRFGSFTVGQVKAKLSSYLKAILSGIPKYPDEFHRDSGI